jgi:hypothetical protein
MKRCSTCNRTYSDPNLSYCIEDGTPLTPVDPQDETTVVSPRGTQTDSNWNEIPYRPPAPYVPPGTQGRQRRVWPWVLGIGGAFILGILAISIAAAFLVPAWMRSAQQERTTSTTEAPNVNQAENSNSVEPANSNSNANVSIDVPPPTDHDQVLAQLKDLEQDWTLANINDDKEALQRILADDWVAQLPDGGPQSKADYIRTNRRDTRIEKWDFDDLKLNLIGDRATLSGKITYDIQDADDLKFDFLDKFVWRDGRWQATGSEVKQRE